MKTKVVTFHSYKGGAGRSSTTLNTLPYIVKTFGADAKHPVLLIDLDLDSAGMTYLLKFDEHFQKNYDAKSFLIGSDLRWSDDEFDDIKKHPLLSKFVPVGSIIGCEDESVLFLGVNDALAFDPKQMSGGKEAYINKLRRLCKNNDIPVVVIDSASGDQFAAMMATNCATDIVCCMRPTFQFRKGTFNYLKRHAQQSAMSRFIILPTVVPVQDVEIGGESQREEAIENIKWNLNEVKNQCKKNDTTLNIDDTFVDSDLFGINEVQRFKWREGVLHAIGQNVSLLDDEKEACRRYAKLAEVIKN